ncbi:unnamed protein product, partial [Allacma fusca]
PLPTPECWGKIPSQIFDLFGGLGRNYDIFKIFMSFPYMDGWKLDILFGL